MARMTICATYALDKQTSQRLKQLAGTWPVSQTEVICRKIPAAVEHVSETLSPADVVSCYRKRAIMGDKEETRRVIRALRKLRHRHYAHRTARLT